MPKRRRRAAQNRSTPVRTVQPAFGSPLVDTLIWDAAKQLLDSPHGYTRWEITEDGAVVVR